MTTTFTVSFAKPFSTKREVSRCFDTQKQAASWAKWVVAQKWATKAFVHCGSVDSQPVQEVCRR
jgi:hypothetical protein